MDSIIILYGWTGNLEADSRPSFTELLFERKSDR